MVSRTCSIGPAVPEDVKVKIVGFQSKNISGEIQIFEGSIVDPSGNERYLVGQVSGIKEIKTWLISSRKLMDQWQFPSTLRII